MAWSIGVGLQSKHRNWNVVFIVFIGEWEMKLNEGGKCWMDLGMGGFMLNTWMHWKIGWGLGMAGVIE
ncbi:MAG: hypothetical protein NPIRA03_23550 [Nitrospirales bacterium]|nr:MAG: hypothetical protein NPIRA03_23550 [Nitrospirales bacterium]